MWKVALSEKMEAHKILDSPAIQIEGPTAYIPRNMVIKDVPEDME
jgi:hypothetical protein